MCFAYLLSEAMTINFPIICHGGCFSTIIIQTSIIICRMFAVGPCKYISSLSLAFFLSFSLSLSVCVRLCMHGLVFVRIRVRVCIEISCWRMKCEFNAICLGNP